MKKLISLIALCFIALSVQAQDANQSEAMPKAPYHSAEADKNKPFYYGTVVEVKHGGAYTYMSVKETTNETFWVVVNNSDVQIGDYVRFKKQLVAKNFESKELNRKFDEIMFADNLEYKTKQ